MVRVSSCALYGHWTPGTMCFPSSGNAFFNPFNTTGNLVSLSTLEMKRLRLRRLNDSSKVTRVAKNQLLVFDKWLILFLLYPTSLKRLRWQGVRDGHKLG